MVWEDTELDRELYGGKKNDMEGEKFKGVWLDNEISLPDSDLAAGKIEKMEFGSEERGAMDAIK